MNKVLIVIVVGLIIALIWVLNLPEKITYETNYQHKIDSLRNVNEGLTGRVVSNELLIDSMKRVAVRLDSQELVLKIKYLSKYENINKLSGNALVDEFSRILPDSAGK